MWIESDVEMTVPIVTKYTDLYPNIASIRFNRGFWSPDHFDAVSGLEVHVILPKKGNKNKAEKERESAPEFQEKRRRHAGIESCINCLEQHGGDRIRTKGGKDGFARTMGASVVATNLCRIGMVWMEHERTLLRRAA